MRSLGSACRGLCRRTAGACPPALLASAFLCVGASASAAAPKTDGTAAPAPSGIAGSPIVDTYDYDASFNGSGYYVDRFAGPESGYYNGQKIARLEDGSYVVAGKVPRPGGVELTQIGLVLYSPSGRRLRWDSVNPAYGEFNDEYIVYPQGNDGQPTGYFTEVVRIEAWNGNLYVLANESDGNYVHPILLTFAYDGFFRGWATYFPGGDVRKPGVDFAIDKGAKTITVLGSDPNNGSYNQLWMSRYTINADGSIGADPGFPFTFFNLPAGRCGSAAVDGHCPLTPVAITTAGVRLVFPPLAAGFYVAATLAYSSGGDTDACVIRFDADGGVDTSFGTEGDGARCVNFDDGGSDADRAVAIARTTRYAITGAVADTVYLAASVARATLPGIGVASLDGSGGFDTGFGSGGRIVFGGCGSGEGDCNFVNVENTPWAMTHADGQLAVVGWYRGYNDAAHTDVRFSYPMLAVLDAGSAAVRNFAAYPVQGNRDGAFFDVAADGAGRFAMAGEARNPRDQGYQTAYYTARLQPDEAIFHDGFD